MTLETRYTASFPDVAELWREVVAHVLATGERVSTAGSLSVGSNRDFLEIPDSTLTLRSAQARLPLTPSSCFNLTLAIARFVWMMSGSDRVQDIAYYSHRVFGFSDDGHSLPGSSFGQRMLHPRPGLNQLEGVLRELRRTSGSRRATVAIYHPEDSVRESRDIPCAIAASYRVRNGKLVATTIMRSSEVLRLLPHDIFDFSLLAEVLASTLEIETGELVHFAVSLHLYTDELEKAEAVLGESADRPLEPLSMPPMPVSPTPLQQIGLLAKLEWELRHEVFTVPDLEALLLRAEKVLHPYWHQFLLVLSRHTFFKRWPNDSVPTAITDALCSNYRLMLPGRLER